MLIRARRLLERGADLIFLGVKAIQAKTKSKKGKSKYNQNTRYHFGFESQEFSYKWGC